MKINTRYMLFDNTEHDTIKQAKEYCLEKMGAAVRTLLYETKDKSVIKQTLDIVSEAKYDNDIFEYCRYRKEHDLLVRYEKELWHNGEYEANKLLENENY